MSQPMKAHNSLPLARNTPKDDLYEITRVSSLQSVAPPEIHMREDEGVGMALAKAANLDEVGYALQSQFGVQPGTIRFSLYLQSGEPHRRECLQRRTLFSDGQQRVQRPILVLPVDVASP